MGKWIRRQSKEIEAQQLLLSGCVKSVPAGVSYGHPENGHELNGKYWVQTVDGPMVVTDGDWIITDVVGDGQYRVSKRLFEAIFESFDLP